LLIIQNPPALLESCHVNAQQNDQVGRLVAMATHTLVAGILLLLHGR
jgi:hypothetical protein